MGWLRGSRPPYAAQDQTDLRASTTITSLIAVLLLCACQRGDGAAADKSNDDAPRAPLVRATQPQLRSMERRLPMTAKMTPLLEAEVVAKVQGIRVLDLHMDVGDEVKKGQLLASLETVELEHALETARGTLAEARAKMDEGALTITELRAESLAHKRTVARKKQVWERLKSQPRGVAQDDVDAAHHDYDTEVARQARYAIQIQKAQAARNTADRARKTAELGVEKAERDLASAKVTAPIDGIVTERMAQVGQVTSTAQPMYRLYDPSRLVARTKLAQHHLRHVRQQQTVRFQGDAYPGITFIATVDLIEPRVDENNAMVAVRLKLDPIRTLADEVNARALQQPAYAELRRLLEAKRTLRPGMFVSGQIVLETREDVVTIPRKAISHLRGQPFVYVIRRAAASAPEAADATGFVVNRLYFREGLSDEGHVEFVPLSSTKKLTTDDEIVLVGQDRLKDGDPVRVEGSEAQAGTDEGHADAAGNGR